MKHGTRPRFLLTAVLWFIPAAVLWYAALPAAQRLTFALARGLCAAAGWPCPYMESEAKPEFWQAPMFPAVVAFVAASWWVRRWHRLGAALWGGACLLLATAITTAIRDTPYLPTTAVHSYLVRALINIDELVLPVLIWLVLTGVPPMLSTRQRRAPGPGQRRVGAARCVGVWALCMAGVATIPFAYWPGSDGGKTHGRTLASSLALSDRNTAITALARLHKEPHFSSTASNYFMGRLLIDAGRLEEGRAYLQHARTPAAQIGRPLAGRHGEAPER